MRQFCVLPLALVCLIGCGGPSLNGKYSASAKEMPPGAKVTMEFNSGKYVQTVDAEVMGMKIHSDTSGTYTFDGKKMTTTVTDVKVDDSKLPEAAKAGLKAQIEAAKNKTEDFDVKIEGDTVTMTSKGSTVTLTKIK